MTSDIFRTWLMEWDAKLQLKSRKILLLVDNCAAHPHLDCLKNIQLEFFPANTTSLIQPLDMGVIKNFKTFYRKKLISYILEVIEGNHLTSSSTAGEVGAKVSILQAIQFAADSWREVSSKTIKNCFDHGFKNLTLESTDKSYTNNIITQELPQITNWEEFLSIDNNLACYNENENCDQAIIEQIITERSGTAEIVESDENDTSENERVTNNDARRHVAALRRYFMQEGNEGSPFSALDICSDFVEVQSNKQLRQSTLDKFLQNKR